VQFMTLGMILAEPQIKAGKLKALAILDRERHPRMPQVPTVVELGYPDLVMSTWFGLAMPAGTPRAIVDRLSAETAKAINASDIKDRFNQIGIEPGGNTPEQAAKFLADEISKWAKVINTAGVKAEQ